MERAELERHMLIGVSAVTIVSGAVQAANPSATLTPLHAENDATTRQFFGTIGMFMVCVGATLLSVLLGRKRNRSVVFWSSVQKFGASGAVCLGVKRGIFSPLALAGASFDALSGPLALDYWRALRD